MIFWKNSWLETRTFTLQSHPWRLSPTFLATPANTCLNLTLSQFLATTCKKLELTVNSSSLLPSLMESSTLELLRKLDFLWMRLLLAFLSSSLLEWTTIWKSLSLEPLVSFGLNSSKRTSTLRTLNLWFYAHIARLLDGLLLSKTLITILSVLLLRLCLLFSEELNLFTLTLSMKLLVSLLNSLPESLVTHN